MRFLSIILFVMVAFSAVVVAQDRIALANGSALVSGTLSNGKVKHYVFSATQGQTITIKNSTSSVFDFRVYNAEFFDEGDYDSSPSYSFEAPETGEYTFTVRKKVAGPRTSRYSMTISIK
ncbi:MAG TPA: hypothetical protein PKA82_04510 [Pyrinomonadaceae bacterium]|nr:hypothetical protein [Pyrinomonadaceae bacterium]